MRCSIDDSTGSLLRDLRKPVRPGVIVVVRAGILLGGISILFLEDGVNDCKRHGSIC